MDGSLFVSTAGGEGQQVMSPAGLDVVAVGRGFAGDAICIGQQNSAAHGVVERAVKVCTLSIELGAGIVQRWRLQQRGGALAGQIGRNLEDIHAASGQQRGGEKLGQNAVIGLGAREYNRLLATDEGLLYFDCIGRKVMMPGFAADSQEKKKAGESEHSQQPGTQ